VLAVQQRMLPVVLKTETEHRRHVDVRGKLVAMLLNSFNINYISFMMLQDKCNTAVFMLFRLMELHIKN